jgi:EmrB/QacA subfamily drug resistance transporter
MTTQLTGARALRIALLVACAMFMELLDATIILTALPTMARSFDVTAVQLSIAITAFLLALAVFLPASGWLADRFGTRTVFAGAIALFVVSSVACGLSQELWHFIVARTLQGAAAGLMSPVGRLAMVRAVDRSYMARAVNLGVMAGLLGPMIGPPLGGFLTDYVSWRWIFFVNVPIGVVGIWLVWKLIPEFRSETPRPFDRKGFVLNGLAFVGLLYGLQLLSEPLSDWRSGAAVVLVGAVIGVFACRHAIRDQHPMLNLAALKMPIFATSLGAGFLFRVGMYTPQFVLPLLLQLGLGMSAAMSGLLLLAHAGTDVLAKLFIIRSLRLHGHRRILLWSAALFASFPIYLLIVKPGTSITILVAAFIVSAVFRSFHMTASNTLLLASTGPQLTSGATLVSLAQQMSFALAVAVAAVMIHFATLMRGAEGAQPVIGDFRLALGLAALVSLLATIWYRRLPQGAGADVSGHGTASPPRS